MVRAVYPILFAGTWSRYSARAMPQLTRAAMYHALLFRFFRWPYQAKVMNMLDRTRRIVVLMIIGILFPYAELGEYSFQDLVCGYHTDDLAQRVQGLPEIERYHL